MLVREVLELQKRPAEKSAGFLFPSPVFVARGNYAIPMSWFSDFKAKRANKAAIKVFNAAHDIWKEDFASLEKLTAAVVAASKGEDVVGNTLMQKSGERTLWSGSAIFHEVGREPSRYVGGSSGVSMPIGGGIRFRVGAQRGVMVPGAEMQMDKDQGSVLLTTERLIFVGPIKTQEWNFDKLLMLSTTPDESDYYISVSNRQKTSGIRFDPATGREFNQFLGSAAAIHEQGYDDVLSELEQLKKVAIEVEPKLALPYPALETK